MSHHTHHALDYVELPVRDLERTRTFYASAFGWSFNDYGPDYAGIRDLDREGAEVGGFARSDDIAPGGVLLLLYSTDLDASLAAVVSAGGTIVREPFDFPGGRRFQFTDPDGHQLGVWSESTGVES
ncbi:MAG: VOC family protein [Dermatophilaceae bacterium]